MANNPLLLNACMAGLTGGMQQRWLTQQSEDDYTQFRNTVLLIAVEVDAAIPTLANVSPSDMQLMQSIAQGVFAGRYAKAVVDFEDIARSISALFQSVRSGYTQAFPVTQQRVGILASELPVTLTLVEAGHTPGTYAIFQSGYAYTNAGAGTLTRTISATYNGIAFNPTNIANNNLATTTTPGPLPQASNGNFPGLFPSDGSAAITVTYAVSGLVGNCTLDLYANCQLLAAFQS